MPTPTRRRFLAAAGALPLAALPNASAQQPPAIPADPRRDLAPVEADLGSVFRDAERLAGSGEYPFSFRNERFRDWAEYRPTAVAKVHEALAYRPAAVELRPEVVERVELDDHVRERILFSTAEGMRVPGYILLPRPLRRPAPAIVDLHSHGGMFLFGKEKVIDFTGGPTRNHPAMTTYHERNYEGRPTATALVRRGYVVVVIDAFFFGERRTIMDPDLGAGWDRSRYSVDDVQRLNQQCRGKETTLAKSLALAGTTWEGLVLWDDMKSVDYLASRPEVDARRIGCLGVSMGGYRTMFLAALDDRIRAACIAGFMSTVRPMLRRHIDTHSWVHFVPGLHRHLDWPDLAALAAPRALMVLQCQRDGLFPLAGMRAALEQIEGTYTKANVRERFAGRFYDLPHIFNRAMQDDAFAFLDRHLEHTPR